MESKPPLASFPDFEQYAKNRSFFIRKKISYGNTEKLFEALMVCIVVYESNKKINYQQEYFNPTVVTIIEYYMLI